MGASSPSVDVSADIEAQNILSVCNFVSGNSSYPKDVEKLSCRV